MDRRSGQKGPNGARRGKASHRRRTYLPLRRVGAEGGLCVGDDHGLASGLAV